MIVYTLCAIVVVLVAVLYMLVKIHSDLVSLEWGYQRQITDLLKRIRRLEEK